MFVRGITLLLTAFIAIGMAGTMAAAEQRTPASAQPEASSSGPPILRHIPGLRILFGKDAPLEEEPDNRKGKSNDFDESYYEPQPAQPQKQNKKKAVTPQKPAAVSTTTSGGLDNSESAPKATSSQTPSAAASTAPAAGLSCEKAAAVISDYGFSDVAPASCAGKVYAFNAKRDGKSFAIKLNAASGELSEVKKLP